MLSDVIESAGQFRQFLCVVPAVFRISHQCKGSRLFSYQFFPQLGDLGTKNRNCIVLARTLF